MKNLKIICYLRDGFINSGHPINIDSLIVHAVLCELLLGNEDETILERNNDIDIESEEFKKNVPVEIYYDKENYVYKSSFMYCENICDDLMFITKRFRANHINNLSHNKKIKLGSGIYKEYHLPFPKVVSKEVCFYCKGDKENIKYLLNKHIAGIGKKQSYGYGEVLEWNVINIKEELWYYNKIFPYTIEKYKEILSKRSYGAYKPIYNDTKNFAECYITQKFDKKGYG